MNIQELNKLIGNIDLYVLDHILKNRYHPTDKILDAGCGEGRNLIYFLKQGYNTFGIDKNPDAINMLHFMLASMGLGKDKNKFSTGDLIDITYPDNYFDHIICSAVLHFSKSEQEFKKQVSELIRVLKRDGTLFVRTATNHGILDPEPVKGTEQCRLPDGSIRFLLTDILLEEILNEHNLAFIEPPKFVMVRNKRTMSTLMLKKSSN